MGLFKPAWQSSNVKTAIKAVKNISDQSTLAEIAKSSESMSVREAAVEKLTDQGKLAYIAKDIRNWARYRATQKLTDPKVLFDVAKNANDYKVRLEAVKKITDQRKLADFAENDRDSDIRSAAFTMLTDQIILADIAKNISKGTHMRVEAAEKLTDKTLAQNIYTEIYKNVDSSLYVTKHLTDPIILADIAKSDVDVNVRCFAFRKLYETGNLQDGQIKKIVSGIMRMDKKYYQEIYDLLKVDDRAKAGFTENLYTRYYHSGGGDEAQYTESEWLHMRVIYYKGENMSNQNCEGWELVK